MKKLKFTTKVYLITAVVSFISAMAICIGLVFAVINSSSTPPPSEQPETVEPSGDNNESEDSLPSLTVPTTINIELLDSQTFNYNVDNLGEYKVSVSVANPNIASIIDGVIIPTNIGTTKIITSINTTPVTSKETTLNIIDCTREVNFYVTDVNYGSVTTYYTNTDYILEIHQNILPTTTPVISGSNISKFELLKTENSSYFFIFSVEAAGEFCFTYKGKYVEDSASYFSYALPIDFNIEFSNVVVTDNTINLYLFNNNYLTNANGDGYYSETHFEIVPQANTIDNIELIEFTNSAISIVDNKISAMSVGSDTIKFYSNISKAYKTFNIVVSEIDISSIFINNTNIPFGTEDVVNIDATSSYNFIYSHLPIYALGEIILNYNTGELNFSNDAFTFKSGIISSTITLSYNNEVIYTLTINANIVITHNINITQSTYTSRLEDSTIYATAGDNSYMQLNVTAINSTLNETISVQEYSILITDTSICSCTDKIINGNINLQILSTGSTTILIIDTINNIKITLTIIVE